MTTVVIDPGHGGSANKGGSNWNNAVGPGGTLEKTLTLDIGRRVADVLRKAGVPVILTRQIDVNLGLSERAAVARKAKAAAFVSIHFNASKGHNAQGTETLVHTNYSPRSARLSLAVQDAVLKVTRLTDRNKTNNPSTRIKTQGVGVLNPSSHDSNTAGCLLEVSFMDRADEETRLKDETYRDAIADAIAKGIGAYLETASLITADLGDAIEAAAEDNNAASVESFLGLDKVKVADSDTPDSEGVAEASKPPPKPFAPAFVNSTGPANVLVASLGAWTDADDFAEFIKGLNLQHFAADEFLYPGASHEAGGCKGLNTYPPRALWPNIKNTALMIDQIRKELGSAIRITSCYRSPAYNACVEGKPASQHLKFNAIDFVCMSGTPVIWQRVADRVRSSNPAFRGGIGLYSTFVHIDTRGKNVDW